MAIARYQHTVIIPEELEEGICAMQMKQVKPESFNAMINRLIRQEMELLCVTTTKI